MSVYYQLGGSVVRTKALLLGAARLVKYEYVEPYVGKLVFLKANERPSQCVHRSADTEEEALQKFIEYLRR
jgi:hypothetical protein